MPYNVLLIGTKYLDACPTHGISTSAHNVVGTLEETGLAKCDWFGFDEFHYIYGKTGDEALIKHCEEAHYDLIILEWAFGRMEACDSTTAKSIHIENRRYISKKHDWLNPTDDTLDILSHKLNIPMIGMTHDSIWLEQIYQTEILLQYLKFFVLSDSSFALRVVENPDRYLYLWEPQDPRLFYSTEEKNRDIPVSFLGRLYKHNSSYRADTINYLREAGIDVFHKGGQREKTAVSLEEYASYIRRSKISLSLPRAGSGISQIQGRLWEIAASGSMILEDLNLETLQVFTPDVDYIAYSGYLDLIIKCRYYLDNDKERIKIAQSGHNKLIQHYNNKKFWNIIFNKLFNA